MLTIHTSPGTGAFVVEAMLEAGTAQWQRIVTDTDKGEHQSHEFKAMNPAAQVPVLKLDESTIMTETAAICIYLGDKYPETGLAPEASSPERPAFLRWMVYMSAIVYEADLRVYYPERYVPKDGDAKALSKRALQQMDDAFAIIENHLTTSQWMAGNTMSVADIYLAMLVAWHPDVPKLKKTCPKISAICDHVTGLDYVQRVNEFHELL